MLALQIPKALICNYKCFLTHDCRQQTGRHFCALCLWGAIGFGCVSSSFTFSPIWAPDKTDPHHGEGGSGSRLSRVHIEHPPPLLYSSPRRRARGINKRDKGAAPARRAKPRTPPADARGCGLWGGTMNRDAGAALEDPPYELSLLRPPVM